MNKQSENAKKARAAMFAPFSFRVVNLLFQYFNNPLQYGS